MGLSLKSQDRPVTMAELYEASNPAPVIKPTEVTNFNRSDFELESFWLFSLFVAGKNADYAGRCLARILALPYLGCASTLNGKTPFEVFRNMPENEIRNTLVASKIGQYNRLTKAITESVHLDLRTCTLEDLLAVHGVGPKTARFFLLHSRRDAKHAVLDTHILSWMRRHGIEEAPKATPQNPKLYAELEDTFIHLAETWFPSVPLAEVDLLIWMQESGRLSDEVSV